MNFEEYLQSLNLSPKTIILVVRQLEKINKENQDNIYDYISGLDNLIEKISLCYASLKYLKYKDMEHDKVSELLGDLNKINQKKIRDKTFLGVSYKKTHSLLTNYFNEKKYLQYVILHLIVHYNHDLPCKVFQSKAEKTNDTQNYLLRNKSDYHYSLHTPTQFYRITSKKFMECSKVITNYTSEDIDKVKEELLKHKD